MENPYEGQYYQPYTPEPEPQPPVYEGNRSFATASLVMGILSLLSLFSFPFGIFLFSGLGILFSCLSKGTYSRPTSAKAGMGLCTGTFAIMTALTISVSAFLLSNEEARTFLKAYMELITSGEVSNEQIFDFLEKYLPDNYKNPNSDAFPDDIFPFEPYDNYKYDDGDNGYEFYEDDLPDFYEQPDSDGGGNFI